MPRNGFTSIVWVGSSQIVCLCHATSNDLSCACPHVIIRSDDLNCITCQRVVRKVCAASANGISSTGTRSVFVTDSSEGCL
uniref:Secreted protein n=1 Tax=Rhipicephalus appendiculatus TaxID=34631 RepID=A0A131YEL5_RHIAP